MAQDIPPFLDKLCSWIPVSSKYIRAQSEEKSNGIHMYLEATFSAIVGPLVIL